MPTLVYPGLRYAHKKLNFACKKKLEKFAFVQQPICCTTTEKIMGQTQKYFCVAIKKMPVIQFPYVGIV